jgi:hypothetical protein
MDKEESRQLYDAFTRIIGREATEMVRPTQHDDVAKSAALLQRRLTAAAIAPDALFRTGEYAGKFGEFDRRGVPLTDAGTSEPLTKSAKKRVEKLYKMHVKKYEKLMAQQQQASSTPAADDEFVIVDSPAENESPTQGQLLPPPLAEQDLVVPIVAGTFGNRQGLRLASQCGPFTHRFEF